MVDISGDSMEPTLKDGGVILVDHQRTKLEEGGVFVVRMVDGLLVRRVRWYRKERGWRLVSDNDSYKPEPLPDDALVIGQTIWTGRRL